MKKLSMTVAAVAIAATTLTGCMKETSTFKVTKAKQVTGELRYVIDNDFVDMMQAFDEEVPGAGDMSRKQYLAALMDADGDIAGEMPKGLGFKVVSGKNFSGWAFTFDKTSFKRVNQLGKGMGQSPKKPLIKITTNKKKQIVLKYRVTGLESAEAAMETELPKNLKPRYKVTASFPGKVVSTNGKLKKRTVTWSGVHPNKDKVLTATSRAK